MALPQYAQSVRYPDFIRTQIRSPEEREEFLLPHLLTYLRNELLKIYLVKILGVEFLITSKNYAIFKL